METFYMIGCMIALYQVLITVHAAEPEENVQAVNYGVVHTVPCGGLKPDYGMALKGHVFQTLRVQTSLHCLKACDNDVRCQSINHVMGKGICELNNRTKEATPEDLIMDNTKLYVPRQHKRVALASIPELPAETCKEIKTSEFGQVVSGKYWFSGIKPGMPVLAHCDMETEDVDECTTSFPVCDVNADCQNTLGSYLCSCKDDFSGDGKTCLVSWIASTIIGNNIVYQNHTYQLLVPAVGNDPNWLLCHRASTHGWDVSIFHSSCDGKNHTVTIIKVGVYVFGGYTDISWGSSGDYGSTSNAFIFSLRGRDNIGTFKSLVTRPTRAIYRKSSFGPTFGAGHDIVITNNANSNQDSYTNFGNSYTVPSGSPDWVTILAATKHFTPDDWEVFYLA